MTKIAETLHDQNRFLGKPIKIYSETTAKL
jgi:hypothetical protein